MDTLRTMIEVLRGMESGAERDRRTTIAVKVARLLRVTLRVTPWGLQLSFPPTHTLTLFFSASL